MKHKNLTLGLLGFLLLIKFVYLPWGSWVESIESNNERLTLMNSKQRKAINNEELALKSLKLHEDKLEEFSSDLNFVFHQALIFLEKLDERKVHHNQKSL